MWPIVRVRAHERALLFRYGDFVKVLGPGRHWLLSRLLRPKRTQVQIVDLLKVKFEHALLDVMLNSGELRSALHVVDLADNERALVWKEGRLAYVLGPGRHAFWRAPYDLKIERYDAAAQPRLAHPQLRAVTQLPGAAAQLEGVWVEPTERVLLKRDGELLDELGPGLHVYWKYGRITWKAVDLREQVAEVSGQEIMTADKVTLRVNLLATYVVKDAVAALTRVADHGQALYRAAQLALRSAIGGRNLDALLADKEAIGAEVLTMIAPRVAEFGVEVREVGLRDIILPGDMKLILNQVIAAEKQAQANLIKRREETAAARSQVNTAKLLAENPVLLRIKELELLQEILADKRVSFVFGEGNLTEQIRRLVSKENGDVPA